MQKNIYKDYGVSDQVFQESEDALAALSEEFAAIDERAEICQLRVIKALQNAGFNEAYLAGSTGYGYGDLGRDALEEAFAEYFRCEKALVRVQFSSGTHVLANCLRGILRPGDHMVIASSEVYDTIKATLGLDRELAQADHGSLLDFGISHTTVDLTPESKFDYPAILTAIQDNTKVIYIQKSLGYSDRKTLLNADIAELTQRIKAHNPNLIIMVDNCYGEMVETEEPTAYGVDLCAGSLIKNLGAGIAESGAYVCGREDLVEKVAAMMTAPGVGMEIGPSLGYTRNLVRGFYFAPGVVSQALKGALHAAKLLENSGYKVSPGPFEARGDIVQKIALADSKKLIAFCEEIQFAAPIDSRFAPIPSPMPGYDCDIIMASGSFIQGSSIELSCDGPLRPPYNAFLQGGLSFTNSRLGVMRALERLRGDF